MRAGVILQRGQSLDFRGGELAVAPELMVPDAPSVEVLDGVSIVANYADSNGTTRSSVWTREGWLRPFRSGEKLTSIDAGTGKVVTGVASGYLTAQCGRDGEEVNTRMIGPGDLLVAEKYDGAGVNEPEVVVFPGDGLFPGRVGEATYRLLGVIGANKRMLGFGKEALAAKELVDVCLAMQYADTPVDVLALTRYWRGRGRGLTSLMEEVNANRLATAYLQHLKATLGEDYLPVQEPRDLWKDIDPPPPELLRRQYRKVGKTGLA